VDKSKAWFKRGASGLGIYPQTWQGWACLGAFLVILMISVQAVESLLPEGHLRGAAFIVAAIEIMAFMAFARRQAEPLPPRQKK
jgi:hypothetical protein